jgi:hypothetical protein
MDGGVAYLYRFHCHYHRSTRVLFTSRPRSICVVCLEESRQEMLDIV